MNMNRKSDIYLDLIKIKYDCVVDLLLNVPTIKDAEKWAEKNLPNCDHVVNQNECGIWVSVEYFVYGMPDLLFHDKRSRKEYIRNTRSNGNLLKAVFAPLVNELEYEEIM